MPDPSSRRILIATDAWAPQVNGVVRTLETTIQHLRQRGHVVTVIEPGLFPQVPCPFYPEIPICYPATGRIARRVQQFRPDHLHIATEGTIGLVVRHLCLRRGWPFTTSYHTKFPEYLRRMLRVPTAWSYAYMRWFHARSSVVLVSTPSMEQELRSRRFRVPIGRWSRGVDLTLFRPRPRSLPESHRPISMYVGRISHEKGIEDFLRLDLPGTKYIVGDGPLRANLERQYPQAIFLGYRRGEALAQAYADADVFVFPSKTDTFGLVMIEALACGTPVAAYPVTGPIDIVTRPDVGCLHDDLGLAVRTVLERGRRDACVEHAQQFTWEHCTQQFLDQLASVPAQSRVRG